MKKYLPITLITVALVILIPTVYALVEPQIVIPIVSGQSPIGQQPLEIKDNIGTNVFAVASDGTVKRGNLIIVHHSQDPVFNITDCTTAQPIDCMDEIAVWQIVRDPSVVSWNDDMLVRDSAIFIGQCSLGGSNDLAFRGSANTTFSETGMQWIAGINGIGCNDLTIDFDDFAVLSFGTQEINFVGFGIRGSSTTGTVSEFSGTMELQLPFGHTLVRVK